MPTESSAPPGGGEGAAGRLRSSALWAALGLLLALLPWVYWSRWPTKDPMADLKWVAAAAGMLVVVIVSAAARDRKSTLEDWLNNPAWRPLGLGSLMIGVGLLISSAFSPSPLLGLKVSLREMMFVGFAVRLAMCRATRGQTLAVLGLYLASAALQAAWMLGQWYEVVRAGGDSARAAMLGTIGNPEYAAGWLAPAVAISSVWLAMPSTPLRVRALLMPVLLLAASAIILSGGRGAALSIVLALCGVFLTLRLFRPPRSIPIEEWTGPGKDETTANEMPTESSKKTVGRSRPPWWPIAAVAISSFILLTSSFLLPSSVRSQSLGGRLAEMFDPYSISIRHRIGLMIVTGDMIADRPVVGSGPGRFGAAFDRRRGDLARRSEGAGVAAFNDVLSDHAANEAHSDPLQWWAEYGLLPAAGLLLMIAGTFVTLMGRARAETDDPSGRLLLAAFATMAVGMAFSFPLHRPARALLFWALIGLAHAGRRGES